MRAATTPGRAQRREDCDHGDEDAEAGDERSEQLKPRPEHEYPCVGQDERAEEYDADAEDEAVGHATQVAPLASFFGGRCVEPALREVRGERLRHGLKVHAAVAAELLV